MIENLRQYHITKIQHGKFEKAIEAFDIKEVMERKVEKVFAQAELDAFKSEEEVLRSQLIEWLQAHCSECGGAMIETADELDLDGGLCVECDIAMYPEEGDSEVKS